MRLSKQRLDRKIKKNILASLYQIIIDVGSKKEAQVFCQNLLSEAEETAVAKRLAILWALKNGISYSNIRRQFQVSPATIAKLQGDLKKPGVKLILKKIEVDKWASHWEKKIKNFLRASQ